MKTHKKSSTSAFTLIELLTVIAIIGILAAIIIPTVSSVRISANKAKTRVTFNQWSVAMQSFKQEYGYFPRVDAGSGNKLTTTTASYFAGALTARSLAGVKITSTTDAKLCGNKKLLSFYSFSDSEFNDAANPTLFVDAFGNTDIAVIYDKDGDGKITTADGTKVSVSGIDNSATPLTPDFTLSATDGPRTGVIFYSAGRGNGVTDIVYSW